MTQQRNALKVPLDSSAANLAVIQNTSDHPCILTTCVYHVTTPSTADASLDIYQSTDGVTPGDPAYYTYPVGVPTVGVDPIVTGNPRTAFLWESGQYLLIRAASGDPADLEGNAYLRWTYLEN